jgi:hypothetical protein
MSRTTGVYRGGGQGDPTKVPNWLKETYRELGSRESKRTVVLDGPVLSAFEMTVLYVIEGVSGPNPQGARGDIVLVKMSHMSKVWIDHVELYRTLRDLCRRGFIERREGGKRRAYYVIRGRGYDAWVETVKAHKSLLDMHGQLRCIGVTGQ